ncbi:hypothetical protein [Kitasatospora sp. NPDC085879]|uniref:hypothetical protein n=1 Tax=Kitasatospora sp. NPDC085879 TaxID=3154769 RepID=UPI00341C78F7
MAHRRDGSGIGLIWGHRTSEEGELLCHHGSTRGFTAFAGFDPVGRAGLVVMGNTLPTTRRALTWTAYATLCALRGS